MTTSPEIQELATALAKAQGEIEGAAKDGENPFFKRGDKPSTYATLASVWGACRAALSKNGLSVVQMPGDCLIEGPAGRMVLTTRLCHSSGQWIEETMSIPVSKLDAQGAVAAITYARRAALAAFVGVAPVDDDGEAAAGRGEAPKKERPDAKPKNQSPVARFNRRAFAVIGELGVLAAKGVPELQAWDWAAVGEAGEGGTFAREKLRRELMGQGSFDKNSEAHMEAWCEALEKLRDRNTPPPAPGTIPDELRA